MGKQTKLEKVFEDNKTLSLRKVAGVLEVNYNMLLKAARKPIDGQVYNPESINWAAIETYLEDKGTLKIDDVDWPAIAQKDVQVRIADIAEFEVNSIVRLRNDETAYKVVFVSAESAQIVIYDEVNNVTRLFKAATFLHQGPKLLPVVEEAAEKLTLQQAMDRDTDQDIDE